MYELGLLVMSTSDRTIRSKGDVSSARDLTDVVDCFCFNIVHVDFIIEGKNSRAVPVRQSRLINCASTVSRIRPTYSRELHQYQDLDLKPESTSSSSCLPSKIYRPHLHLYL